MSSNNFAFSYIWLQDALKFFLSFINRFVTFYRHWSWRRICKKGGMCICVCTYMCVHVYIWYYITNLFIKMIINYLSYNEIYSFNQFGVWEQILSVLNMCSLLCEVSRGLCKESVLLLIISGTFLGFCFSRSLNKRICKISSNFNILWYIFWAEALVYDRIK